MLKGPIARATIRTSFVLGLRLVVQAGTLLLVARMLGPEQFGAFAGVAALAVLLGTLASLGSNLVLLGAMSKDTAQRDQILPWAIPATLVCGAVLLVVFIVISKTILSAANLSLMVLLAIGSAEIWLQPLFTLVATEHHAQGRIALSQLLHITPLAMRTFVALGVFLLAPNNPLELYAFGYFLSSTLPLLIVLITISNPWPAMRYWRLPTKKESRLSLGYAATNMSRAGTSESDKTLATYLLSLENSGIYAAAVRVLSAITLPVTAMTLSALPRLFRDSENKKQSRKNKLLPWMYIIATIYGVLLSGLVWLFSPLFEFVFGAEYLGLKEIIRYISIAIPAMTLRRVSGNALIASNQPWLRVLFELSGTLVLIVSGIVLVGHGLQMHGMLIAFILSEWSMALLGAYLVWKNLIRNKNII